MSLYINLQHYLGVSEYPPIPVGHVIRIHRQAIKLSEISGKYNIIILIATTLEDLEEFKDLYPFL